MYQRFKSQFFLQVFDICASFLSSAFLKLYTQQIFFLPNVRRSSLHQLTQTNWKYVVILSV